MTDWIEIPIKLIRSTYGGVRSFKFFWGFFPFITIVKEQTLYREIHVEVPCPHLGKHNFLLHNTGIPYDRESIIIGCSTCGRELMRVSGFVTKEYKMWVHEDVWKGRNC